MGFSQSQGINFITQGNKNVLILNKKLMNCSGSILINLFQDDIFWPFTVPFKYNYVSLLVLYSTDQFNCSYCCGLICFYYNSNKMEETLLSMMKIWSAKLTDPTASVPTVKYFLLAVGLSLVTHTVNGATSLQRMKSSPFL